MAPSDLMTMPTDAKSAAKYLLNVLTAPLFFFDAVDKERLVLSLPWGVRRFLLKALFWPTLLWTMLLHRAMPEQRRWFDRVDSRVIIGALPLKRQVENLARIERVTGVINLCDEFEGLEEYEQAGIRQLRLPVLDYCSPTAQQLENGLDFIRKQPLGGSVYVHCKAGRGRAGTMLMAYLIDEKQLSPAQAQAALSAVRPHVSPRLWKRAPVREMHRRVQQRALLREREAARAAQMQAAAAAQQAQQSQQAAAQAYEAQQQAQQQQAQQQQQQAQQAAMAAEAAAAAQAATGEAPGAEER